MPVFLQIPIGLVFDTDGMVYSWFTEFNLERINVLDKSSSKISDH